MSIDNSIVRKIAKLSRIKIDSNTQETMKIELNNILSWVDSLQEVNTDGVEPMLSIFKDQMELRLDEVNSKCSRDDILKNAPEKKEGFFVVPKVIE